MKPSPTLALTASVLTAIVLACATAASAQGQIGSQLGHGTLTAGAPGSGTNAGADVHLLSGPSIGDGAGSAPTAVGNTGKAPNTENQTTDGQTTENRDSKTVDQATEPQQTTPVVEPSSTPINAVSTPAEPAEKSSGVPIWAVALLVIIALGAGRWLSSRSGTNRR